LEYIFGKLENRVADPHSFHPDPDPIWIQGFNDQKMKKKITAEKNYINLGSKTTIYLSLASIKNVQVTEEDFRSQKRPSNTSKHEPLIKFPTFVGHFCPPGSGSGFRIRIRIH
jgi:hypothetical protein